MVTKLISTSLLMCFTLICVQAQIGLVSIPKSNQTIEKSTSFSTSKTFQISNGLDKYYVLNGLDEGVTMEIEQAPLGIFCKLDKSLDQKFPFNLRFRLGEFHYTNGLEYGDELGRRAASEPLKKQ